MGFWIYMLVMDLLIPGTMIGCGLKFKNAPPQFGSSIGYLTRRSAINRNTWDFAHQYIGRLWLISGVVMLPVSILSMVFLAFGRSVDTVGTVGGVIVGMQCAVMVLSIFPTERALKRNFDDYGRRK